MIGTPGTNTNPLTATTVDSPTFAGVIVNNSAGAAVLKINSETGSFAGHDSSLPCIDAQTNGNLLLFGGGTAGSCNITGASTFGNTVVQSGSAGVAVLAAGASNIEIVNAGTSMVGPLTVSGWPTTDPHVVGELWSNLGIITQSSG